MENLLIKKQAIPDYREPTPLEISTITYMNCFNATFNLQKMFYQLPLVKYGCEGIYMLKMYEKVTGELTEKQQEIVDIHHQNEENTVKKKKGNKPKTKKKNMTVIFYTRNGDGEETSGVTDTFFQNQLTALWCFKDEKEQIKFGHSMIFANGNIKSAGVKDELHIDIGKRIFLTHLEESRRQMDDDVIVLTNGPALKIIKKKKNKKNKNMDDENGVAPVEELPPPVSSALVLPQKEAVVSDTLVCRNSYICLVKTDFNTNMTILRDEIYRIIKRIYHIIVTFESEIYPGVKICYSWNEDYQDRSIYKEGICYCSKKCSGKGVKDGGPAKGNGRCKIVTICVFQSGKINITGGNSLKQTLDAYTFINRVLKQHYENIVFVEPIFEKPPMLLASEKIEKSLKKTKTKKTQIQKPIDEIVNETVSIY